MIFYKNNFFFQVLPRDVTVTSNAINEKFSGEGYINITCASNAEPSPMYYLYENGFYVDSNMEGKFPYYVEAYVESRRLLFSCYANNSIGGEWSEYESIILSDGMYIFRIEE